MNEYLVESWFWSDPAMRERETFPTWRTAESHALELAAEGYDVAVYRLETTFMGEEQDEEDEAARNGVQPGLDFPATLAGGRSYAA